MSDELLHMSASDIARHIRNRDITPLEAVNAHISRILKVNPKINAVITPIFDQARQQAQDAQAHIEEHGTQDLSPLFGVPMTIKDCYGVQGVRFTGGSWHMRRNIAEADADPVRKLRDAGAIFIGKTNLPDMCWSPETSNPIFGQTNNPHHLKYTAGGSSGGEGAIIAAGGSPLGLGSDVAGSVRIPAAANGIVSLKPTANRIPPTGHVPAMPELLKGWNTAGPMARRVEDLALALSVLSETPTRSISDIEIAGRKCLIYIENGTTPVDKQVSNTVAEVGGVLKQAGLDVVRDDTLPLPDVLMNYFALMSQYGNMGFRKALGGGTPYKRRAEIAKHLRGVGEISLRVLAFTETVDLVRLRRGGEASFGALENYRQRILNAMGDDGILLTPLLIKPVAKHGWSYNLAKHVPYTTMFNSLSFPCVVVPITFDNNGLPLSVQIVARPDDDEVALAVAAHLEKLYGGWQLAEVN